MLRSLLVALSLLEAASVCNNAGREPLRGDGGVEAVERQREDGGGGEPDRGGEEAQPRVHAQDGLAVRLCAWRGSAASV
jgi:hypothetical protein